MNVDQLRAALRETADEVQPLTIRPLELPPEAGHTRGRRLTAPPRRWLPVAGAAAAICLIAAVSVAVASGHRSPRPGSQISPALAAIPHYYAALLRDGTSSHLAAAVAIKDSRTGATITTDRPPAPFATFTFVSGAADDRTFVLAAQGQGMGSSRLEGLFRARFSPQQHTLTLTQLPMPAGWDDFELGGIALSPSGTELAISGQPWGHGRRTDDFQVSVLPLAGGLVKTWTAASLRPEQEIPELMSFGPAGMLAVSWLNENSTGGVWLLNTSTAGGSFLAHSRLLVPNDARGWITGSGVLSGDGRTMAADVVRPPEVKRGGRIYFPQIAGEFREYSVETGKLIRILWPAHAQGPVYWSNTSGSVLVVLATTHPGPNPGEPHTVGVLSRNRITPLPGATNLTKIVWLAF